MSATQKRRQHLGLIEYLLTIGSDEREKQLSEIKNSTLKFLVNLIFNIVHKRIDISADAKKQLMLHKSSLVRFTAKKKSLKERRNILVGDDTFKKWFDVLIPDLRKNSL